VADLRHSSHVTELDDTENFPDPQKLVAILTAEPPQESSWWQPQKLRWSTAKSLLGIGDSLVTVSCLDHQGYGRILQKSSSEVTALLVS
jgi:hypothetical protein